MFLSGHVGLSFGTLRKAIILRTEKLEGTNVFTRILFIIAITLESKFSTIGKLLCKICLATQWRIILPLKLYLPRVYYRNKNFMK